MNIWKKWFKRKLDITKPVFIDTGEQVDIIDLKQYVENQRSEQSL